MPVSNGFQIPMTPEQLRAEGGVVRRTVACEYCRGLRAKVRVSHLSVSSSVIDRVNV